MAFETLGLNITASGIAGVARQMGHLANSFIKYINVVERTDRAALKTAASQNKLAQTMSNKAGREVERLEKRYASLTRQQERLQNTITVLNLRMGDGAKINDRYKTALNALNAASKNFANETKDITQLLSDKKAASEAVATATTAVTKAQEKLNDAENAAQKGGLTANLNKKKRLLEEATAAYIQATAAVERYYAAEKAKTNAEKEYRKAANALATYYTQLRRLIEALEDVTQVEKDAEKTAEDLEKAKEELSETTENLTKTTQTYEDMVNAASEQTNIFGRLLSDLTGGFGKSTVATSGMTKALGLTVPQLAAVMVAMDAVALVVKAVQLGFNMLMSILKTAWAIFTKTVQVVWNLAKAVGTTLWNALKKIASFPFNIINKLFGGMGGSMQRVMEMAIGMNMSRVWWQLGLRFRELAKTAADAATEYQVTFMRLRGLMLNEVLGKQGVSASDPDYIIKYNAALLEANKQTQELVTWTSKLAVATIFDAESILDVYTLAMAYDFTSKSAKELTTAVLDFATGMGLGDTEMRRVIENFGQMRAQGKIVGTELRDLARGAFVPVNEVLERMAKNAGVIGDYDVPNLQEITSVLTAMRESGELTESTFAAISTHIAKLGSDGKITRQEFEGLAAELKDPAMLQRFGLTAEQAGKALEGIKTGQLTKELNDLIATGKLTIDEFFEAFIEMAEDRFPNAAMSMGLSMKALRSNLEDYIKTMFGWRLLAPVFEVVAKHVQDFVQNSLMSESQIQLFDRMGLAFKTTTELLFTYSNAVFKAGNLSKQFFGMGNISQMWRFANEFASIIGSLGTEEFANKFNIFKLALKQIPLAGESRQLVLGGIQELNKIMSDIMAGIEVEPEALKKAMSNVFGTLWKEYFKPELGTLWDENVIPAIKKKIGELWESIKSAFNNWKTDKLMPGLQTFFSTTLPGWISSVSTWVSENGAHIIQSVIDFVTSLVGSIEEALAGALGENNPIVRLLDVFRKLGEYASFKISDPTSELNKDNLAGVTGALENFALSLKDIIMQSDFAQNAVSWLNTLDFSEPAEKVYTIARLFGDVADNLVTLLLHMLGISTGINGVSFDTFLEKVEGVVARLTHLTGSVLLVAGVIQTLTDGFYALDNMWKYIDWENDNPLEMIKHMHEGFSDIMQSGRGQQLLESAAQSINNSAAILNGTDAYGAAEKVDTLVKSINDWTGLSPLPLTDLTAPFAVTPDFEVPPGFAYDYLTGKLKYIGGFADSTPLSGKITLNLTPEVTTDNPNWYIDANGDMVYRSPKAYQFINPPTQTAEINLKPRVTAEEIDTAPLMANLTTTINGLEIPIPATPDTGEIGTSMGQGIIDGINNKRPAAVAAAAVFVNAVNAEFLKLWKIESPSKVFVGFGENLINGLVLGIKQSTAGAVSQARDAAIDIKHGFGSSISNNSNYSYTTNSNNSINNWNVKMSTPIMASTPLQAYEVLRMRAR